MYSVRYTPEIRYVLEFLGAFWALSLLWHGLSSGPNRSFKHIFPKGGYHCSPLPLKLNTPNHQQPPNSEYGPNIYRLLGSLQVSRGLGVFSIRVEYHGPHQVHQTSFLA